ncbi:MAG TPA: hypothetical protein VNW99_09985 [Cytophagaceae bacterium]|jgi:hypothetical protein|nr:hypothetical protein [Cytophagaceae bacterium]
MRLLLTSSRKYIVASILIDAIQMIIVGDLNAQDLANIDKKNPIKITGGINATQTIYNAWGIQNRRDPYYWLLNANLNFNILGVSIPISATFSQQSKSFTQPFNQLHFSNFPCSK